MMGYDGYDGWQVYEERAFDFGWQNDKESRSVVTEEHGIDGLLPMM